MSDAFSSLVQRVTARLQPPPLVSPEQYRALECNRCGLCCEDIPVPLPPPDVAVLAEHEATNPDWRTFLSGLEPVEQVTDGWRYRCRHFTRDASGLGLCAIHATRPDVCRGFPYSQVVRRWRECAWYVQVVDSDGNAPPVGEESARASGWIDIQTLKQAVARSDGE